MEEYRVTITEKAINDIIEISNYITNIFLDNEATDRLVHKMKVAIQSLTNMPKWNALLKDEELKIKGIRMSIVENYIIFYICSDRDMEVSIIRVLYSKRDWQNLI